MPEMMNVFIISLDDDIHRRKVILRELSGLPGFKAHILRAVNGATLPDAICRYLVRDDLWAQRKGTIGCFLSHVCAWERVLQLGNQMAVIVEDDANVQGLGALSLVEMPEDADLLFLNDQMSPPCEPPFAKPKISPTSASLGCITKKGPGAYGYALTTRGARKLVSACAKDLYYGHVDSRLLRYCTTEADLESLPADSYALEIVRKHHNPRLPPKMGLLRGYCITPPLIGHYRVGSRRTEVDVADTVSDRHSGSTPGTTSGRL